MCVLGDWHSREIYKDGCATGIHVACQWKCGVCPECLAEKRKDYTVRSYLEMSKYSKFHISPKFYTLTYNQFEYTYSLRQKQFTRDWQLFLKRLRKYVGNNKIRYIRTVELGSQFERLHFHVIFFNLPFIAKEKIEELWQKGFVKPKKLTSVHGIRYVCKYISKPTCSADWYDKFGIKRKVVCSRSLGVNNNHSEAYLLQLVEQPFVLIGGYKTRIGKYMTKKLIEESKYDKVRDKYNNKKLDFERRKRRELKEKYSERPWFGPFYRFRSIEPLWTDKAANIMANVLEEEHPRKATVAQINDRLLQNEKTCNLKCVRKYKDKIDKQTGEITKYPVGYVYIFKHSATEIKT